MAPDEASSSVPHTENTILNVPVRLVTSKSDTTTETFNDILSIAYTWVRVLSSMSLTSRYPVYGQ